MRGVETIAKEPDARVEQRPLRALMEQAVKDTHRYSTIALVAAIAAFSVFIASLIAVILGYDVNPVTTAMALGGAVTALFGAPLARTRRHARMAMALMMVDAIENARVRDNALAVLSLKTGDCDPKDIAERLSEWSADAPIVMRKGRTAVIADSAAPADVPSVRVPASPL